MNFYNWRENFSQSCAGAVRVNSRMIDGGYTIGRLISRSSKRFTVALAPLVLVGCCWGQNCSSVVVPLNVLTKGGSLVRNITPQELSVQVHGKKAQVVSLNLDTSARRVVLLVDTSGSMASNSPEGWERVVRLGDYALDTVPPNASVAVGSVSDDPDIGPFGSLAQAQKQLVAITRKPTKGRTRLLDAIHLALTKMVPAHFGDVIYVVTDGGDNHSSIGEIQLEKELAWGSTRVFVLLTAASQVGANPEVMQSSMMRHLAQETGGYFALITNGINKQPALVNAVPFFQSYIGTAYRMQLLSADNITKPASLQVRYRGPKAELPKHVEWIYPHNVDPCGAVAQR